MGAVRFLYNGASDGVANFWPSATLTESSQATALPAEASQNPDRSYVWRSLTQTADQTLQADFGAAKAVTCAALANVRLQNAGSVKLQQAGSGGAPGAWSDVVTFDAMDADTKVTVKFFDSVSARWWRLYFTNGVPAVADYAELGYAHVGGYFQPSRQMPKGFTLPIEDPSVARSSVDGQEDYARRSSFVSGELTFPYVKQSDLVALEAIFRRVGVRTPFFLVLDTNLTWMKWLVRFAGAFDRHPEPGYQYTVIVPIREAR